jgi:hypothetical protein
MSSTLENACKILIESQGVPIQLHMGSGREFAQLIVDPANSKWWKCVAQEIKKRNREW